MSVSEAEVALACRMLREGKRIARVYTANILEAQQAEIGRLRQVIRCADYFVVAGQDLRYDKARAALVKFDTKAATHE